MSLNKSIKIDKIEIVGDYKIIQVREATVVTENNVELSRSFHRYSLAPNDDISSQPEEIKGIANVVWTEQVKKDYIDGLSQTNQ
tara:strand:- start:3072 stop:3323 length:252 start_codon:yes stop_codon:yes gene_type:complete